MIEPPGYEQLGISRDLVMGPISLGPALSTRIPLRDQSELPGDAGLTDLGIQSGGESGPFGVRRYRTQSSPPEGGEVLQAGDESPHVTIATHRHDLEASDRDGTCG